MRTPKRIRLCPGCGKLLRDGVKVSFCEDTGKVQTGVVYVRRATAKQTRRRGK